MKKLMKFEKYKTKEEEAAEREDKVQLLNDLLMENPLHVDNDFYLFIARDEFKEAESGLYKKTIDIENMVKIEGDSQSLGAIQGMQMRSMFQHDCSLYHIWLPKELEHDISGKGSGSLDEWLVELINKYKVKGTDQHGKDIYKKVIDRKKQIDNYNL